MNSEDKYEQAVFDDRPEVRPLEPDEFRFGDIIVKRPKRGSRQNAKVVDQIRFIVGQYPDAKTLALALKEAGISANDAHLLAGALVIDNRDPKIYDIFLRMQSAAAQVSIWQTEGFRVREDESPYTGESGQATWGRDNGAHPEARYRRDGDDRE